MILLGVDLGERRIGFAVCDPEWIIASPLRIETTCSLENSLDIVCDVFAEVGAERIILGHPIDMSGRRGPKAKEAEGFARDLEERGLPIILWDERLTTAEAERSLRDANLNRKERKKHLDAIAAQRILHSFMEAHNRSDLTS